MAITPQGDSHFFVLNSMIRDDKKQKGYTMQESDVIVKTDVVRVRIMSLAPHEVADWHYHTVVTDDIFCLTGIIVVRKKEPEEENKLNPGGRSQIKPGRTHQLENLTAEEATYLLVQGIGKYDYNVIQS